VALLDDSVIGAPKKKAGTWFTEKISELLQTAEYQRSNGYCHFIGCYSYSDQIERSSIFSEAFGLKITLDSSTLVQLER